MRNLLLLPLLALPLFAGAARAADSASCLACHRYPNLVRVATDGQYVSFTVDEDHFGRTVHRKVACTECHAGIKTLPHGADTPKVDCGTTCHVEEPFTGRFYSHERIAHQFAQSRHAPRDRAPELEALKPTCTYCHDNEVVHSYDSFVSDPARVLVRCVRCHDREQVAQVYDHMLHRQIDTHTMDRRKLTAICSDCHADRELMARFDVSEVALSAVETYRHNVHAVLVEAGSRRAPTCADCHTAHEVRQAKDPSALVYRGLGKTVSSVMPGAELLPSIQPCGRMDCHPKATERFATIEQHPVASLAEDPAGTATGTFFFWLTSCVLFGLLCIILLEALNEAVRPWLPGFAPPARPARRERRFHRMSLPHRVEHLVLLVSFIILCVTGLSLRFSGTRLGVALYDLLGGPEVGPWIHRIAGVVMCALFLFHTAGLVKICVRQRRWPWEFGIFPRVQDALDLLGHLRYLLFLAKSSPPADHYSWKSKFDYFAVYWGIPVFGLSGPVLWNPEWFSTILPPWAIRVALIAHSDEALLAGTVIVVWHMWNVHLRPRVFPIQWTFLTGDIPEGLLAEEHALEYARLERGEGDDS